MTPLKWKTVYSETVIQSSYKNYHFSNFGESIVRHLKFRCTLVKIPLHNFQFRTGANLNYFIFDEKHSTFYLGKKLNILLNQMPLGESESYFSFWPQIYSVMFLIWRHIRKKIDQYILPLSETDIGFQQRLKWSSIW